MKSKPINSADSNHASELSDAALVDILGGCTGYAQAVEGAAATGAQLYGDPGTAAPPSGPVLPPPTSAAAKPAVTASPTTPQAPPAAAITPHVVPSGTTPAPASATTPAAGKTLEQAKDNHDWHDGHHGHFREAMEAAHDRFHEAMDQAHDGFEHMVEGAAEIAIAAVELNPVVAGLHVLHDLHHPARGAKKA